MLKLVVKLTEVYSLQFMQLPLTATCDVSVNIDEKSQLLRYADMLY